MTHLASYTGDRRLAPRYQTRFTAELAAGTILVPVMVQNLSRGGCGVAIMGGDLDLPDEPGGTGLLHLPALDARAYGTIFPVVLRNVRSDAMQPIYGLEFRPLLPHQMSKLIGILDTMLPDESETRP